MATIGLLCADDEDRRKLALTAGEAGHLVHAAGRLQEAVEILRESRPRLMLVGEAVEPDAETIVREVLRVSPLLPIVVALKRRDAARAVKLMRAGAAEVVAAPWTREQLSACLSKSLRFQGTAFSIVRAPRRTRTAPFYFFAVAAFFACALGVAALKRQERLALEKARHRESWDLPYRHPAALAFDDGKLWIADWFTQSLYVHDPATRTVERIVHFPDQTPVSLAFGAEAAWTVSASGRITRRMKDVKLSELQVYADAHPSTLGMAFDGLYLWTCDSRSRRIHKLLLDERLTEVSSYRYPGVLPVALVYDGKTLWSLDAGNHELIRHNLERPDEATARVPLPEYADGQYRPVGVGFDGERFWTVGERLPKESGPARLFRHLRATP